LNKKQIKKRQDEVASLLINNKTETEIAKILRVSRGTVVRDVSAQKKLASNWLDSLPKGVFVFEYKLALDKLKQTGAELANMYDKAIKESEKLQILKAKDENTKLYFQLLAEAPVICAFKKAIKNTNVTSDVQQS
jgi:hypothetical protein